MAPIILEILAWTCPLNGQIESGIDRCVGRVVYPDCVTGSSNMIEQHYSLRSLTCRILDSNAVSPVAPWSLRGLTCSSPDRYVVSHDRCVVSHVSIHDHYVVSLVALLIATRSHL